MGSIFKRFPIYSKLLQVYPTTFRKQYSEQMLYTLADQLDNASSKRQRFIIWLHTGFDLVSNALRQNILVLEVGMAKNPTYVKRNSLIGACLLLPFVAALMANNINNLLYEKPLYGSWLWSAHIILVWVLVLPAIASILTGATLAYWLFERHASDHKSWRQVIFDFRRSWPLVIVCLAALGVLAIVFGHDKVQCFTHNPVNTIQYWRTTWQCASNN